MTGPFVGDLGAVDVKAKDPKTIELVLYVEHQSARWKVTVFPGDYVTVHRFRPGAIPDLSVWDTMAGDDRGTKIVIGYALRRAICRGIDTAEVVETSSKVEIDLGKMPW